MVTVNISGLTLELDVCINDVLVSGPPVWRVSVRFNNSFWNETAANGHGALQYSEEAGFDTHHEIELQSAAEIKWFEDKTTSWLRAHAQGDMTKTIYNKYRGTCPVKALPVSRRRAADTTAVNGVAASAGAAAAPTKRPVPAHTVGTADDSLGFTFVVLGEPSEKKAFLSFSEPYTNEVRAGARRYLAFLVASVHRDCGCGRS
jgi:hypothetical protein